MRGAVKERGEARSRTGEGRFGWVVVAAGALTMVFTWGTTAAMGVLLTPVELDLGWSRSSFSWAVALFMGLAFALSGPWGWLVDRWSARGVALVAAAIMAAGLFLSGSVSQPWHLYLTLGVLGGVGLGAMAPATMAPPARWIDRRRGLALGVVAAGTATGWSIMPQIAEALLSVGDWRSVFRALGVLIIVVAPVTTRFFREPPWFREYRRSHGKGRAPVEQSAPGASAPAVARASAATDDLSLGQAARTLPYWLLGLMYIFALTNIQMAILHVIPSGRELGLTGAAAASLGTVLGAASVVSKTLGGYMGDRMGPHRIFVMALALQALALLAMASGVSLVVFFLGVAIIGFTAGAWIPQIPTMAALAFGSRHMGAIYGSLMMVSAGGSVGGPLLGAWLYDMTGAYTLAYTTAAGVAATSFALGLLFWWHLRRRAPATSPVAMSTRP